MRTLEFPLRRRAVSTRPAWSFGYIDGEREAAPDVDQLATGLADIHRVGDAASLAFLRERFEIPAETVERPDERRIRDALASRLPLPRRNRPVLLHGDFWPGNTLWREGRLVGVIDWDDAAFGEPLADLANGRLEILWALGMEAMDEFTRRYESLMPEVDLTDLPYWDLWADLRLAGRIGDWGLDAAAERALRAGHDEFVAQAIEHLSAR